METQLIIDIQATGAAKTVRELKQEISDLRDKLVTLDVSSTAYSETVKALIADETKLTEVMKAGKTEVSAATGSYNALVNEMASLKKVWRAVTDEATRSQIGERINEINDQLKEMDASIGNSQRKVGSYEEALAKAFKTPQQELKNLRKELAGLKEGTEEYNAVFARMAELTHTITEQNEKLKWSSSDFGDIMTNLTQVTAGVVGGISAINAAMGLLGEGTEDVQKAMLKTQQFMALIQGLSKLEELRDRIEGLWKGLKNFTTHLTVGTANLDKFSKASEGTAEKAGESAVLLNAQGTATKDVAKSTNELAAAEENLMSAKERAIINAEKSIEIRRQQSYQLQKQLTEIKSAEIVDEEESKIIEHKLLLNNLSIKQSETRLKGLKLGIIKTKEAKLVEEGLVQTTENLTNATNESTIATNRQTISNNAMGNSAKGAAISTKVLNAALKGLKTAIAATGIGLLVMALGELLALIGKGVGSLWKWVNGTKEAEERTKALTAANEALNASLEVQEKAWSRREKLLNAQGASYEDIYKERKKNLEAQYAEVKAELATYQAVAASIKQRKYQSEKYADFREELEDLTELEKNLAEQISDLDYDKYIEGIKAATEAEKARQEAMKAASDEARKLQESLEEYYKTAYQKLTEKYEKEKLILTDTTLLNRKYLEDLKKLYYETYTSIQSVFVSQEERKASLVTEYGEKWLQTNLKVLNEQEILAKQQAAKKVGFEEKSQDEIAEMDVLSKKEYIQRQQLYNNELLLIEQEYAKKERKVREENFVGLTDKQRQQYEVDIALATTMEEELNAKIALAEYDLSSVFQKEGESVEQYQVRVIELIRNLEELNSTKSMLSINETQLKLDNDAFELNVNSGASYSAYWDAQLAAAQFYYDNLQQLQGESNEQFRQRELEAAAAIVQIHRDKNLALLDNYTSLANGIGNILGSVADFYEEDIKQRQKNGDISEEQAKREFETVKNLQIAQTTISTIAGAVAAYMGTVQTIPGPWGVALGAVQAAVVTAAGVAEIAKIKNTQYGSTGGGSSLSAMAVPATNTDYSPTYTQNITGEKETENLANALAGAVSSSPIQTYVVESQMTAAQEIAAQRQAETTF